MDITSPSSIQLPLKIWRKFKLKSPSLSNVPFTCHIRSSLKYIQQRSCCENFTLQQEEVFVPTNSWVGEMPNQTGNVGFFIGIGRQPHKRVDCGNDGAKNVKLKERETPKVNSEKY
jgi:hypothetical protein